MFTGIIQHQGKILHQNGAVFTIQHDFVEPLWIGESIAINGMCCTVTSFSKTEFTTDIMEESRNKTSFSNSTIGTILNLEKSAKIGDRNSGHNVSGHIDQTGKIIKIEEKSDFVLVRIAFDTEFFPLVIKKGSIAIDGISLTISQTSTNKEDPWIEASIIPHTWKHTNLSALQLNDPVNLEFDQLGKYIIKFLENKK